MHFLDDIGPGFDPGNNGTIVNPIIIAVLAIVVIAVIITAVLIKKGKK